MATDDELDELVAEYDPAGALLRRYVHGPGVDEPLLWYEGSSVTPATRRFLHADHHGTIVTISDQGGGAIALNRFDPWGVAAAGNLGRFSYTGQIAVPELAAGGNPATAMLHYKARTYAPQWGRFLQTDPVAYEDQVNLYAYARNDAVNALDPDGTRIIAANAQDAVRIQARFNELAKAHYEFNENLVLERSTTVAGTGGSETYAAAIDAMIASDRDIKADIAPGIQDRAGNRLSLTTDYNGGVTLLEPGRRGAIEVDLSGRAALRPVPTADGGTTLQTAAEVQLHEFATHALPASQGQKGGSLKVENKIRDELNRPRLAPDKHHRN